MLCNISPDTVRKSAYLRSTHFPCSLYCGGSPPIPGAFLQEAPAARSSFPAVRSISRSFSLRSLPSALPVPSLPCIQNPGQSTGYYPQSKYWNINISIIIKCTAHSLFLPSSFIDLFFGINFIQQYPRRNIGVRIRKVNFLDSP